MGHWNYRVVQREGMEEYSIREVYYNDDGEPTAWSQDDYNPTGLWDSISELKGTVELLAYAFNRPTMILDAHDRLHESEEPVWRLVGYSPEEWHSPDGVWSVRRCPGNDPLYQLIDRGSNLSRGVYPSAAEAMGWASEQG